MSKKPTQEVRHIDSILTKNRGLVRLTQLKPETRLQIGNKWVSVKDIPLNTALLSCGHNVRGIALTLDCVVFCERCQKESFASEIY